MQVRPGTATKFERKSSQSQLHEKVLRQWIFEEKPHWIDVSWVPTNELHLRAELLRLGCHRRLRILYLSTPLKLPIHWHYCSGKRKWQRESQPNAQKPQTSSQLLPWKLHLSERRWGLMPKPDTQSVVRGSFMPKLANQRKERHAMLVQRLKQKQNPLLQQ